MRVTKNLLGEFIIEDEPMRLEGEEADQFLAAMRARDEAGNDPARKQFLEQCAAEYRRTTIGCSDRLREVAFTAFSPAKV